MKPNILIDAAPKSGSSHIKLSLQRILGYRDAYLVNDNVINSSAIQILIGSFGGQILHHHVIPSPCNASLMRRYSDELKVVITQRNLFDTMVSLKEYLENANVRDAWDARSPEVRKESLPQRRVRFPFVAGDDWLDLDDAVKYSWIARNSVPWYLSFFVSWAASDVPHIEVWYEDFFKNQVAGIRRILEWVGIEHEDYSDAEIRKAINHRDGKFNKGRSGRGRETLPQNLIDVVYDHADSWGPYWGKRIRKELLD